MAKKSSPRKQSGDKTSTIASKAMKGQRLTQAEIRSLGASVLSQDETKGKRKP